MWIDEIGPVRDAGVELRPMGSRPGHKSTLRLPTAPRSKQGSIWCGRRQLCGAQGERRALHSHRRRARHGWRLDTVLVRALSSASGRPTGAEPRVAGQGCRWQVLGHLVVYVKRLATRSVGGTWCAHGAGTGTPATGLSEA